MASVIGSENRAPSARHICSLAMIFHSNSVQERHRGKRTEEAAPPGLGILMASSGYKDSAPDGVEDSPQPMALIFKPGFPKDIPQTQFNLSARLEVHRLAERKS